MSLSLKEKWDNLIKRDPVKAAVASSIQRGLRTPMVPAIPSASNITDDDIVTQAISPLESIIRVKTGGEDTRYFRVRVSEMY